MDQETKEYIEDYTHKTVESKYHTNENYMRAKFIELAGNITDIKNEIPGTVDVAIEKYVNGNLRSISANVDSYKLEVQEMQESQEAVHKEFRDELEKRQEKIDEGQETLKSVKTSLDFLHRLGGVIQVTAKIVGSMVVISGAFWAFFHFVIFNA
mgnify:CR=1 FL=1|tara:strand:- start:875 stop:1336 length:462 start_codon:yes stop_codon:yes gene_type:complete